jgi:hypothetical protein
VCEKGGGRPRHVSRMSDLTAGRAVSQLLIGRSRKGEEAGREVHLCANVSLPHDDPAQSRKILNKLKPVQLGDRNATKSLK